MSNARSNASSNNRSSALASPRSRVLRRAPALARSSPRSGTGTRSNASTRSATGSSGSGGPGQTTVEDIIRGELQRTYVCDTKHPPPPFRPACSELIRSYSYYDAFHQGAAPVWHYLNNKRPEDLERVYSVLPVPREQVRRVALAQKTTRRPFNELKARDIDDGVLQDLNSELRDGTHPTTQALIPLGMRFLRVLGAGTQGTAVLFEVDGDDGTTRKIVAKYDTDQDEDSEGLELEKRLMKVSENGQSTVIMPTLLLHT